MPRYNKDPNPSAANNLTGITGTTSTVAVTPTRVTNLADPWSRPTAARVVTPSSAGTLTDIRRAYHNPGTDLSGLPFSAALELQISAIPSGATVFAYIVFVDSGAANLLGFVEMPITTTSVTTVRGSGVAASGTRQVGMWVRGNNVPSGWTVTTGLCRVEQIADLNIVPADGGSDRWAWDGTAGSSTSTRLSDDGAEWWALTAA